MDYRSLWVPQSNTSNDKANKVTTYFCSQGLQKDIMSNERKKILDAKYEKVEIEEVVDKCKHLGTSQKQQLMATLKEFSKLFSGRLGNHATKTRFYLHNED